MDRALTGRLLVATPMLDDPNFRRTVVLICDHNGDGAFGLVLNRPLDVAVGAALPAWDGYVAAPAVVFQGGPVEPSSALALGRHTGGQPTGFNAVVGDVGLLDLNRPPAEWSPLLTHVRLFAGYSGWGAGQLEAEIAADAWWVVDARASDVFLEDATVLWRRVLRRQPLELAIYHNYPDDRGWN